MFNPKILARNLALAGAATLLLGSSAFAQSGSYPRTARQAANRGFANRVVEGTVASVARDRNGDHVRLTNGMDLIVPNTITAMNQGRRYGASMLQPGDVVRMNVYSREGDGRDAQVRSLEILQTGEVYNTDRPMTGTVVSVDRRSHLLVLKTDNGRTVNVTLNSRGEAANFRRGDRVSISGRMNRGNVIADDIRLTTTTRPGYRR
jgi:hypothetical protein